MIPDAAIDAAVERLRPILDAVEKNEDSTVAEVTRARDQVLSRFGELFRPDRVPSITEEEFRAFLLSENNKHWPLHRLGRVICSDMDRLRRALSVIVDESRPVRERLNQVRDKNGELRIKGFGRAVISAVLHVAHPDSYAVWNQTTHSAMKTLGIWPPISPSQPFGDRYVKVNDVAVRVAQALGTDLWTLDALWWRVEKPSEADAVHDQAETQYGPESAEEIPSQEIDAISSVVNQILRDSAVTPRVWRALGQCVEEAARQGAPRWALTHTSRGLQLNVGRLMIVALRSGDPRIRFSVVEELLTRAQREQLDERAEWGQSFRSAPGVRVALLSASDFADLFDSLREPIFEAIRTGGQVSQTPYFAAHSPAAVAWLERELGHRLPRPSYSTPYWKIAPGEGARLWEQWCKEGYASVGWPDLGDLTDISDAEFEERAQRLAADPPGYSEVGQRQALAFSRIPEGSYIVANRGTREVLGLGRVTGPYEFTDDPEHPHRLPVEWFDTTPREVNQPGWRRTVIALQKSTFETIAGQARAEGRSVPTESAAFSERTFELLRELSREPTKETWSRHREELQAHVEQPAQSLMEQVADRLPAEALDLLETRRRIFGRILKNDYGRGGAYDYFWGAFYPKGRRRIDSPQLFIVVKTNRIDFGFSFGTYEDASQHCRKMLREADESILSSLDETLASLDVLYGTPDTLTEGDGFSSLEDWLANSSSEHHLTACRILTEEEVLEIDPDELVEEVSKTFAALFPIMLMATQEDPWPAVRAYLDLSAPEGPTQASYTIADLRAETGFEADQLQNWVRVLRRKKQVILQGPPGTGKTFIAQRLARLLVSETPGAWELVQFHPAYAYEDFMQGIRPQVRDGGLSYQLEPGQFLRFCERARQAEGHPCVLMIDEINRANLARVFGELMYLLEYRDRSVQLAAGGREFRVPENVHLIGTMNTADRSITRMDHAMRRRFTFIRLKPDYGVLRRHLEAQGLPAEALVRALEQVNREIDDPDFEVGISYFMSDGGRLRSHIGDIWRGEIEPYLEEYFYDQPKRVARHRWDHLVQDALIEWA